MSVAARISTGMASQLETGARGKEVGRDIVLRIAKAFAEPEGVWLDLAGMTHDPEADNDFRRSLAAAIDAEQYLTAEQKRALKKLYRSFRSRPGRHD